MHGHARAPCGVRLPATRVRRAPGARVRRNAPQHRSSIHTLFVAHARHVHRVGHAHVLVRRVVAAGHVVVVRAKLGGVGAGRGVLDAVGADGAAVGAHLQRAHLGVGVRLRPHPARRRGRARERAAASLSRAAPVRGAPAHFNDTESQRY